MFFFVICLPFPRPYSSFWFCLPVARNYTLHSLSSVVFLLLSNIRALAYFNLVPPLPICAFPLAWLCPRLETVTVSHGYCTFSSVPTLLFSILSSIPHLPLGPCSSPLHVSICAMALVAAGWHCGPLCTMFHRIKCRGPQRRTAALVHVWSFTARGIP